MTTKRHTHSFIEKISGSITKASGSNLVIVASFIFVLVWIISGPFFNFSQNWLQIVNTFSSIVTFLMVFLIQKAQNKDYLAIQIKLNELLSSHELANNQMVNVENKSEEELEFINEKYSKIGAARKPRSPKTD